MSKYTAFRCPEDLLELAKIKARKDRRSLSNYIITLIERDVQDLMIEGEPQGGFNGEAEQAAPQIKEAALGRVHLDSGDRAGKPADTRSAKYFALPT